VTNSLHYMTSEYEDLHLNPEYEGLIYLADSEYNPPILRPHKHRELEVNLVVRGSVTYVMGTKRYSFDAGMLLWLFPGQRHQLVKRSKEARLFVAVFKPNLVEEACQGERYEWLKNPQIGESEALSTRLGAQAFRSIREAMDGLAEEALDVATLNREAGFGINPNFRFQHQDPDWLNAGLRQLLLLCWRSQGEFKARREEVQMHPAVRKALDLLENEDGETMNREDLASACGISSAYLTRIFHKQVGVTIGQYRNSMKLGRFWRAFHGSSQAGLAEASYTAGFGSYSQFYRVFKDAYGTGPRKLIPD
jgi:AraC-like DNA-binding protein/mannose-6-phosphate isomerase-like protein (cupin superfamily)